MDHILTSRKSSCDSRSSGQPTNKPTRKQIYNLYLYLSCTSPSLTLKPHIKLSTHQSPIFYVSSWVSFGRPLCSWLEGYWRLLSCLIERNTEFEKLRDHGSEILEEKSLVLGILIDPLLESLVGNERHVGRKHH